MKYTKGSRITPCRAIFSSLGIVSGLGIDVLRILRGAGFLSWSLKTPPGVTHLQGNGGTPSLEATTTLLAAFQLATLCGGIR